MSGRNEAARYAITNAILDGYSVTALFFRTDGMAVLELIERHEWSNKSLNLNAIATVWREFETLCIRHNAETVRIEYYNKSLNIILYA